MVNRQWNSVAVVLALWREYLCHCQMVWWQCSAELCIFFWRSQNQWEIIKWLESQRNIVYSNYLLDYNYLHWAFLKILLWLGWFVSNELIVPFWFLGYERRINLSLFLSPEWFVWFKVIVSKYLVDKGFGATKISFCNQIILSSLCWFVRNYLRRWFCVQIIFA